MIMIKKIFFALFAGLCLVSLSACTQKNKENFKNLSSDDFEQLIQDENVQVVDVRTVAEYSQGHLPNSLNINVLDETFSASVDEQLDIKRPVAVYCRSGKRSRNAAKILEKKGYTVYNLDKGFEDWKKNNKEIEL